MDSTPTSTVEDYEAEIATLEGQRLLSKAGAANNIRFVGVLREQGLSPGEIERVFLAFARQFVRVGVRAPERGLYDLNLMGRLNFHT